MTERDRIPVTRSVRWMILVSATLVLALGTFHAASAPKPSHAATEGAGSSSRVVDAVCVTFEGLPLGTTYNVGDAFLDSRARITVRPFTWSNGIVFSGGFTAVENGGLAGGTGNEMQVNNVNLSFDFAVPLRELAMRFGEYGGNLNIQVNSVFRNFSNMAELDGTTMGGVGISVVNGMGNDAGILELTGRTTDFAIGGQELWIDDVCIRTARLMLPLVFRN